LTSDSEERVVWTEGKATHMIVVEQSDEVLCPVARDIIELHILVHAQCYDEANATVGRRAARLTRIHVAPLEVPDGGIA